ncbi:MAG: DUF445 domain-containing protein [Bacillota bacterium]
MPFLGAVFGALAVFVSLKALFWPAEPRRVPLLGWRLQGLIPGHQEAVAKALGRMVEERVLSRPDLFARLVDPALREEIVSSLAVALESRVRAIIPGIVPAVATVAAAGLVRRVAERELGHLVSRYLDQLAERVEGGLGLGKLVEERVRGLTPAEMEDLVTGVVGPQLRRMQVLGAFLGLVVGLGQAAVLWPFIGR